MVQFGVGKDPDEVIGRVGVEGFQQAVQSAKSWVQFVVERMAAADTEKRYALYERLGRLLLQVPDPFLRRAYADEIQRVVGIEPSFWESFRAIGGSEERRTSFSGGDKPTADRELLRIWVSYPYSEYGGRPLWAVLREALGGMTLCGRGDRGFAAGSGRVALGRRAPGRGFANRRAARAGARHRSCLYDDPPRSERKLEAMG